MKKLFFLVALMTALAFSVSAYVPGTNCFAIYQVPLGEPYADKVVRPPWFTVNRFECVTGGISPVPFPESPGNGVRTQYQLAIPFWVLMPEYYPIRYIDQYAIHIYTFGVGQTEIPAKDYSIDQGTGIVTFDTPPAYGEQVYFEVFGLD